jgi:hypothetical protein
MYIHICIACCKTADSGKHNANADCISRAAGSEVAPLLIRAPWLTAEVPLEHAMPLPGNSIPVKGLAGPRFHFSPGRRVTSNKARQRATQGTRARALLILITCAGPWRRAEHARRSRQRSRTRSATRRRRISGQAEQGARDQIFPRFQGEHC